MQLSRNIGQIGFDRGCLQLMYSFSATTANIVMIIYR